MILDRPFGISNNISLNSLINGGSTRIKIAKMIKDITAITKINEINLGSLKTVCIWLHKLQTILETTKEQIIKRKKSLRVHINKKVIKNTANLKYIELPNLKIFYFFSEYPNPFDLA